MTTLIASEVRVGPCRVVDQTAASHEPIAVAGKGVSANLIAKEVGRRTLGPMRHLSIPGMHALISEGMGQPAPQAT
jgi:PHD/YefM family antitoxin component YafN of YafNO toxin-antitoxin module